MCRSLISTARALFSHPARANMAPLVLYENSKRAFNTKLDDGADEEEEDDEDEDEEEEEDDEMVTRKGALVVRFAVDGVLSAGERVRDLAEGLSTI